MIKYTCDKGHKSKWVRWDNFKNGNRFAQCAEISKRTPEEEIREYVGKEGYILNGVKFDEKYHKTIINKGHKSKWVQLGNFKNGKRFAQCAGLSKRTSEEEIKESLEKEGYILNGVKIDEKTHGTTT